MKYKEYFLQQQTQGASGSALKAIGLLPPPPPPPSTNAGYATAAAGGAGSNSGVLGVVFSTGYEQRLSVWTVHDGSGGSDSSCSSSSSSSGGGGGGGNPLPLKITAEVEGDDEMGGRGDMLDHDDDGNRNSSRNDEGNGNDGNDAVWMPALVQRSAISGRYTHGGRKTLPFVDTAAGDSINGPSTAVLSLGGEPPATPTTAAAAAMAAVPPPPLRLVAETCVEVADIGAIGCCVVAHSSAENGGGGGGCGYAAAVVGEGLHIAHVSPR